MDCGAGSGKYCVDDGASAAYRNYFAAFVLWRYEYDLYRVLTWASFTTFVLYWKRGKK